MTTLHVIPRTVLSGPRNLLSHGSWSLPGQRRELLGLEFLRKRIDDLVQLAVHDGVDLVERQIDPVIGHAPLRKVVGANALAPVPRPDQALPMRGFLLLPLLALLLDKPRRQHRHRL